MAPEGPAQWLANPAAAADRVFQQTVQGSGGGTDADGFVSTLQADFAAKVVASGAAVPQLGGPGAAGSQLVHFRGMVQHHTPGFIKEILVRQAEGGAQTSLFREWGEGEGRTFGHVSLCTTYLVPVPGESNWREGMGIDSEPSAGGRQGQKRLADGSAPPPGAPAAAAPPAQSQGAAVDAEMNCVRTSGGGPREQTVVALLAHAEGTPEPALNSVIDVWGVLEPLACVAATGEERGEGEAAAKRVRTLADGAGGDQGAAGERNAEGWPQATLEPYGHLQAALARRLAGVAWQPAPELPRPLAPLPAEEFAAAAESLRDWLTGSVFGGDATSAEMFMLQLASSIAGRHPVVTGTVPINFTNLTPQTASAAARAAGLLHPRAVAHTLSLETLNNSRWIPQQDVDTESLLTGRLQLVDGALVVLDETAMEPGRLSAEGVGNLRALSEFAADQLVMYDFGICQQPFHTAAPVAVLSTVRSMLRIPFQCPTACEAPPLSPAEAAAAAEAGLSRWRQMLASCRARSAPLGMAPGLERLIEGELSTAFKDFPGRFIESALISDNTVHHWLTTAKLVALTQGATEIGEQHWRRAAELGRIMLSRIPPQPQEP